jgi:hypothetical protein
VAIGELVCDNRRIAMIHPNILAFPHLNKLKILDFLTWKLNSPMKKL